jgi:hypothetical protein
MKLRAIAFLMVTGCSLLLGLLLRNYLQQKTSAQVSMAGHSVEIPLAEYGNHLYIQGKVNGTATDGLLLDSGATDIFISESKAKKLNLKAIAKATIPGPTRNIGTVDVPGVTLQLGGVTVRDQKSVMIPNIAMTRLNQYFGRSLTGIVGYELFQQLVVEVDYQHHVLRFYRPETYRYPGKTKSIPLAVQGSRPYVEATVLPYGHESLKGLFMVDMGSGGGLSVSAGCGVDQTLIAAAPHMLLRKLTTIHGASDAHIGRVQNVQIGPQRLERPLTVFAKDVKGECDRVTGKIGHQILRQFKVILDYSRRQLILEPNANHPADPYEYDLSGLWLQATGADFKTYRIGAVFPNTPAAKAGFQTEDILTKINGESSAKISLAQIKQQLSQSGKKIKLEVKRNSKTIQAELNLQPLL